VLAAADMRGVDSHGVARLRSYFDMLTFGRINPRANVRLVREFPGGATVDGDNGLGLRERRWYARAGIRTFAPQSSVATTQRPGQEQPSVCRVVDLDRVSRTRILWRVDMKWRRNDSK
jgi:hypothetical protein